jgi:hypothetical protein
VEHQHAPGHQPGRREIGDGASEEDGAGQPLARDQLRIGQRQEPQDRQREEVVDRRVELGAEWRGLALSPGQPAVDQVGAGRRYIEDERGAMPAGEQEAEDRGDGDAARKGDGVGGLEPAALEDQRPRIKPHQARPSGFP